MRRHKWQMHTKLWYENYMERDSGWLGYCATILIN